MGLTVLSAAGWPGDPFVQTHTPRGRAARRASRPEAVRVLSPDAEEALDRLLFGRALDGLPMLSSWDPVGPPRYLRGAELDQVVDEAGRALAAASTPDDARAALAELVALVDDARRAGLLVVLLPD